MIGEAELLAGNEAAAKTAMFAGMAKSMDKVTNFYPRTDRFDWYHGLLLWRFRPSNQ